MLDEVENSQIENRLDVYNLAGIICDNLFQKDSSDEKSVIFYFDGKYWKHDNKK